MHWTIARAALPLFLITASVAHAKPGPARTATEAAMAKIKQLNNQLHAVIAVNPEALAEADALDKEPERRGPLHGVTVLLKDNIATRGPMATTAGSLALAGVQAPRDAFLVARLRQAGAIIVGKANLSEWANLRSTTSSSGWSAIGGQTRNPYALDRTPCGSSSGTGAAVAVEMAQVGVGTETDGSILCPSSMMGLVGLKPTVGLVSRAGVVPIAHSQDTAGPMTRTVADAAALLTVLAAPDPDDPNYAEVRKHPPVDYGKAVESSQGALQGARLGVLRTRFGGSPPAERAFAEAIQVLKQQGAVIVDPVELTPPHDYGEAELDVMLFELKADLEKYLATWAPGAAVKTLADVVAFNQRHRAEELAFFGQEYFERAVKKGPLTDLAYVAARDKVKKLASANLEAVFAQQKLDAIVVMTSGPAWLIDLVNGDGSTLLSTTPAAAAGTPAITVPTAMERGLPMGLTFMGRAFSEATLLRLAAAYEAATHARRQPMLPPTVALPGLR